MVYIGTELAQLLTEQQRRVGPSPRAGPKNMEHQESQHKTCTLL